MNHLLLSIILAYDYPADRKATAEARLARARLALFGERPPPGRSRINDDVPLFHIASEVRKSERDALMRALLRRVSDDVQRDWEVEIHRKPLSARAASREQAAKLKGASSESSVERLRHAAQRLSTKDLADIEGLIYGNSHQAVLLSELRAKLRSLGIKTVPLTG